MRPANDELKPNPLPARLAEAEKLRAQRIWLFIDVMFINWVLFCVIFWLRGYHATATICQTQALCYLVIQLLMRKKQNFKMVMNSYLICCGLGVLFVALSHPGLKLAVFFFPSSILVASYLFGTKQATYWFLATLLNFTVFSFFHYGAFETIHYHFDELLLSMGTSFCLFLCCQQAEWSFQIQNQGLVDRSRALKKRSDELELLATTDSLTGLTNRYQFQIELETITKAATDQNKAALFLIDMDGFKDINDTMGHITGDEVLVEIGERLLSTFGHRATVARLGGDEFCVLFGDIANAGKAEELATEIFELLCDRYKLSEAEITLGTSVGYAICPDHGLKGEQILSFADTAMYHAKNNKLNIAIYHPQMTESLSINRLINEQLADALTDDEFHLVFQPQINTLSGKTIGAEALIRWQHEGKVILPSLFIPLLEETGRIVSVGKWLIREACRQQAEWKQMGHDLILAVNVSPLQFIDDGFVDSVIQPLTEFGVSPAKLELEITEGILIDNVEQVIEKLTLLKEFGCRISIDDFGTGYSSLAYLRQFPLDKLKIDRTFVQDIPDTDDGVIASSIIILADLMGLEVIAEGVETPEQLKFLQQHGCNQYQGFFFSRPVDADEIITIAKSPHTCKV